MGKGSGASHVFTNPNGKVTQSYLWVPTVSDKKIKIGCKLQGYSIVQFTDLNARWNDKFINIEIKAFL